MEEAQWNACSIGIEFAELVALGCDLPVVELSVLSPPNSTGYDRCSQDMAGEQRPINGITKFNR